MTKIPDSTTQCGTCKTIDGCTCRTISMPQALAKMVGDQRSQGEIAKAGARRIIGQIDKLRDQLRQAEQCCQHIVRTGRARHDDERVWKRVAKAADRLLDGMS